MSISRVTAATAVTLAAALGLTACGPHHGGTAEPGTRPKASGSSRPAASSVPEPIVTVAGATKILRGLEKVNNRANATQSSRLLATYETGASYQFDAAGYRQFPVQSTAQQHNSTLAISYFPARFEIPASGDWFLAYCALDVSTAKKGSHYLMVIQRDTGGTWKIAAGVPLAPGVGLPALSRDSGGAPIVVNSASSVDGTAPDRLADTVDDLYITGGKGAGEKLRNTAVKRMMIQDYSRRDDWIKTDRRHYGTKYRLMSTTDKADRRLDVNHQVFALRTADGGALVVFPSYLDRDGYTTVPGLTILTGPGEGVYIDHGTSAFRDITTHFLSINAMVVPATGPMTLLGGGWVMVGADGHTPPPKS